MCAEEPGGLTGHIVGECYHSHSVYTHYMRILYYICNVYVHVLVYVCTVTADQLAYCKATIFSRYLIKSFYFVLMSSTTASTLCNFVTTCPSSDLQQR